MESYNILGIKCSSCYKEPTVDIYCTGQELFGGFAIHGWPVCADPRCVARAKLWCEEYNMKVARLAHDGYIAIPVTKDLIFYLEDGKINRGRLSGLVVVDNKKVYVEVWDGIVFPELPECPCLSLHKGELEFQPLRKWIEFRNLSLQNPFILSMFRPKTLIQNQMIKSVAGLMQQ